MKSVASYLVCLVLSLFLSTDIKAQTFFEDVKGETSVHLPTGGITRINTAAKSLKIGYYYNRSDKDIVLGVDASGMSNNGLAPLVINKKLSPEANINFNLGFKNISTDDSNLSGFDYLNLRLGIGTARYTLLDTNAPFEQQISAKSFTKINIGLSYNYYLNGNMVFGAYTGYDRTNNISNLTQLTIKETTITGVDANGTTRTAESEYTVWEGEFMPLDQFSLFLDYVYLPDFFSNRIALSVYSRNRFNSNYNITNGGFGIYLNKEGEPLRIIGGLIYEFEDLLNNKDAGTSLGERGTLGIVLGYNF